MTQRGPLRAALWGGTLALACVLACSAQPPKPFQTPHAPLLGAAWYPEQWPEREWEHDLDLMQDAHMNVVRIGEFAWSSMEPSEGHYDLDWMERAIALAAKHHIAVVIGTPTDAPPAWLTKKYPDTLGMNADGHWREHGGRRQFNYASPRYRQFCAAIVLQLARRFGHNPNVIGWQIGNEYTDESFDPATRVLFQQYVRAKYKTLDNLNRHWAADCGPQPFTDWSQIPLDPAGGGPPQLLEHKHFVTETWRSFQRVQIDVLRPRILANEFITTNIGGLGWSDNWDHYALTADLDLASWDDYVGQGHLDAPKNAMLNDFVRGWKRQNFWLMETQPGSVNWAPINNSLYPGETRALAWQTIGHGADAVLYWQWRDALNGQEEYHGAIVGPDGSPLPIYYEIKQLGEDLDRTRAEIAGTSPHAEIAILHDYDSRWAIDFQPFTKDYDQQQVLIRFYTPLQQIAQASGHAVDIVDPNTAPLDGYKLLVAPSLNVISDELAAKLTSYVQHGGHLLLGPRSGMKDQFGILNPQRQPGPLIQLLGGRVEQYYALDHPAPLERPATAPNLDANATVWAEMLKASSPDARVVLRYAPGTGWLAGQPAMITRTAGKGSISYLGTLPDRALLKDILASAVRNADADSTTRLSDSIPENVEICERDSVDSARRIVVVINHNQTAKSISLAGQFEPLLTRHASERGSEVTQFELAPQGIAIFEAEKPQ